MWVVEGRRGERKKIVRPPELCTTKGREEGRKKEGRRRKEEEREKREGKHVLPWNEAPCNRWQH